MDQYIRCNNLGLSCFKRLSRAWSTSMEYLDEVVHSMGEGEIQGWG